MKNFTIQELRSEHQEALSVLKGHNKITVRRCLQLLNEMPNNLIIQVRENTKTIINTGDLGEIFAGRELGFLNKNSVSINANDLPTLRKNEIKVCYSNNRPSNDIEDKGHYMVHFENGSPEIVWVSREVVRSCKEYLIKGRRGGSTYAREVLKVLKDKE